MNVKLAMKFECEFCGKEMIDVPSGLICLNSACRAHAITYGYPTVKLRKLAGEPDVRAVEIKEAVSVTVKVDSPRMKAKATTDIEKGDVVAIGKPKKKTTKKKAPPKTGTIKTGTELPKKTASKKK